MRYLPPDHVRMLEESLSDATRALGESRDLTTGAAAGVLGAALLIFTSRVQTVLTLAKLRAEHANCQPGCVAIHRDCYCGARTQHDLNDPEQLADHNAFIVRRDQRELDLAREEARS